MYLNTYFDLQSNKVSSGTIQHPGNRFFEFFFAAAFLGVLESVFFVLEGGRK
jgi:hypothetical protein